MNCHNCYSPVFVVKTQKDMVSHVPHCACRRGQIPRSFLRDICLAAHVQMQSAYFPPVMAIPSMNCFWNTRYRITIGIIASIEPAMSIG